MFEACSNRRLSPDIVESLFAIALGFAVAGLCASGYRPCVRCPELPLARSGPMTARVAAVPLLVFAAPFSLCATRSAARRLERRRGELVMVSTVIAGLWSLMSGTVVVMALQALLSV